MTLKKKLITTTLTLSFITMLGAGNAFAQMPTAKPGWGVEQHMQLQNEIRSRAQSQIHVGPPGSSVRPNPEEMRREIRELNEQLRRNVQAYVTQLRSIINNWVLSVRNR